MSEELRVIDGPMLTPYSDGRDWDERMVVSEISHHLGSMILHAYEAGRRLIWAKASINHGNWGTWLRDNLRISERSAQNYMAVAELLIAHPRLIEPASSMGLKKTLLLTGMPEEWLASVTSATEAPEGSFKEWEVMSYTDLKNQLNTVKRERDDAVAKGRAMERELETAKAQAATSAALPFKSRDEIVAELKPLQDALQDWITQTRTKTLALARAWDSLDPDSRLELVRLLKTAELHIQHELMAIEDASGRGDVVPAAYNELLRRAALLGTPVPERRRLPMFGDNPVVETAATERARR